MYELQVRIIDSTSTTSQASSVTDELLGLNWRIIAEGQQVAAARSTLEELIALKAKLGLQGDDLKVAENRVSRLIQLKDDVVAGTENLMAAIETFERTSDLQEQFHEASQAFDEIRRVLAEVVMLRSGFVQVVKQLKPLTELVNLRRLTTEEIRHMAHCIASERCEQISKKTGAPSSDDVFLVLSKAKPTSTSTN